MHVELLYGQGRLPVDLPSDNVTVVQEPPLHGLPDEKAGFLEAVGQPIGGRPLHDIVRDSQHVAVVIPDGTRPLPFRKLLGWFFECLADKKDVDYTIVVGTGSHRGNTRDELIQMMGPEIVERYRIVNHDAHDPSTLAQVGETPKGGKVLMNRNAVDADVRIGMGFIEPHFLAGFSGGYKAFLPGIAGIDTIMDFHRASVIGNPRTTWGELKDNPTQELVRRYGTMLPMDFLINITMTADRAIMGYYCGDPIAAHEQGSQDVKRHAMRAFKELFPIVLTTNNGFPLDQNLYQAVKGTSAAACAVTEGGLILQAARCNDGFPEHGNFKGLLYDHDSPQAILDTINTPEFSLFDQWEAQLHAMVLVKARVGLYSELSDEETRRAHLIPVRDMARAVDAELDRIGRNAPIAVLPEGFTVIPYLEAQA